GFAWVLGIWGFLSFNLLLMLIAFFVYSAATSELAVSVSRGMLQSVTAQDALIQVNPVHEEQTINSVAEEMMRTHHRILPVRTGSQEPAIVSVESLRRVPRARWSAIRVKDIMERVPKFLQYEESLDESLPELSAAGALPVQHNRQIVGLVRYTEISE